jgi:hypothetical protein
MTADADGTTGEIHRYFPEWADRPAGPDTLREADRNSYLAGGYADEFGYGIPSDRLPVFPPLLGDPESSPLWHEQIGALHPGYPQCAKPLDRTSRPRGDAMLCEPAADHRAGGAAARPEPPHPALAAFRAIAVAPRARGPLSQALSRVGVVAYMAERLIRWRHLNDVV